MLSFFCAFILLNLADCVCKWLLGKNLGTRLVGTKIG